jgi:hypothetical protein
MVDPKLLKLWALNSTKDNGNKTYKPKTSMPETGQEMGEGFELKPDGTFIQYWRSDAGKLLSYTGKYEIDGDSIITHFKNHYLDSRLKIENLDDDQLEIR